MVAQLKFWSVKDTITLPGKRYYSEIVYFRGYKILRFDDIGHIQLYAILQLFHWDLKFVDCPTHQIHEIKCPTNKNDFTV